MLYSSEQIRSFNIYQRRDAVGRYLHILFLKPKKFHSLKLHEKDFLFRSMKTIQDDYGHLVYNLYKMPEAIEFVFFDIIQLYGEDVDSFSRAFYGPYGKLSANRVRKDQRLFNEYLQIWRNLIQESRGPYLVVIKPLLNNKLKELKCNCNSDQEYKNREKYCYAVFFWIYYRARLYFEERKQNYLSFNILGYTFVANIYTYCHIFSRHYVPSLNVGLDCTMNSDIPCIDINNFLESIKNLILLYFNQDPKIDEEKEYLLYRLNGKKFIIWIKYKRLNELSHQKGFEVRSFYKCEKKEDLDRFIETKEVEFANDCYCCIEK